MVSDHSDVTSFVGDLASGFSGNLGYPLPKNWAFDQIKEYTIGSGSGAISIDKNIYSGRDLCVDSMSVLSIEEILTSLFDTIGITYPVPQVNSSMEEKVGDFIFKYETGIELNAGSGPFSIQIEDGKFKLDLFNQILEKLDISWMPLSSKIKEYMEEILGAVVDGGVSAFLTNDEKLGPGIKIKLAISATRPDLAGLIDIGNSVYASIGTFPNYGELFAELVEVLDQITDVGIVTVSCIIVAGLVIGTTSGKIAVGQAIITEFISALTAILKVFI